MTALLPPRSGDRRGTFRTSLDDIPTGRSDSAVQPENLLGTTLGVYRLDEVIGVGAVGVVYRAWDCRSETTVALKVLRVGLLATADQRRSFKLEAIALSRCVHTNVAAVLDFGTSRHRDYLVMELVAGQSIAEMLDGQPLASAHVAFLGEQLGRGLSAAHGAGVIHRDIKPGNLRVTPAGRLKIVDFGLARTRGGAGWPGLSLTRTGSGVVGTLPYMAPEQIAGEAADDRTDVYGAGAVLYEMACGRPAFPQKDLASLVHDIRVRPPAAPSICNPAVWPSLEDVILKALAKRPEDRFSSADELAERLARVAAPAKPWAAVPPANFWRSMTSGLCAVLGLARGAPPA